VGTDSIQVDAKWLAKWNRPVPRYTSYPTAPQFKPIDECLYKQHLANSGLKAVSLYIHIPFCRSMCLFCGCSVVLNRKPERQADYLNLLLKEIELVGKEIRSPVSQLHLGGGTPTSLTIAEFEKLMETLHRFFVFEANAEKSIEIDPRTVYADGGEKLSALKRLGFNRVSFGVQDLDPKVQEAVKRRQSEEMSRKTFEMARQIGFEGINIDLIYGLPFQTVFSFTKTVETLSSWKPDRIALFSYAKVPWLKPHQKAIAEETLPSTEEKFEIYVKARKVFMEGGYTVIGMDHFSLHDDSMSVGYREGKLYRNFQGYSLNLAENMIGLGITSIGFVEQGYFQNKKEIAEYEASLACNQLPVGFGLVLSAEDRLRRWVIQELMCRFELDKQECEKIFFIDFDDHFKECNLDLFKEEGLLEETGKKIIATPLGRLVIRLIASAFDAYLIDTGRYSKLV
jgi:oxygen-independent coproporphyrinogen-3 oxidase